MHIGKMILVFVVLCLRFCLGIPGDARTAARWPNYRPPCWWLMWQRGRGGESRRERCPWALDAPVFGGTWSVPVPSRRSNCTYDDHLDIVRFSVSASHNRSHKRCHRRTFFAWPPPDRMVVLWHRALPRSIRLLLLLLLVASAAARWWTGRRPKQRISHQGGAPFDPG